MADFTSLLLAEITTLRTKLQEVETLSEFELRITVSGRVHDGDLKLSFQLDDDKYDSCNKVTGNNLPNTLAEFLRRVGWTTTHRPLCLSYQDTVLRT